jgi:hypothetical protein
MNKLELYRTMKEEQSRPKIPEDVPEALANLIRACWQADATKRPKFHYIQEVLEELEEE